MARLLISGLLALALLTLTIPPTAGGDKPLVGAPDVVEIDASTGELASPPALAGTNVTVRVHDVPASQSGFDLEGPTGPLFVNQSSRHDGVVAFWDVPAIPGTYNVTLTTPEGVRTLASTEIAQASQALVGEACGEEIEAECSTRAQWCWWGTRSTSEKLDEETYWTPLLAVNSPSDGKAVADSRWTETKSVMISPGTWSSEIQHSNRIDAYDGEAQGFYRMAKWGIYERTDAHCFYTTTIKEAKVIDWKPAGYVEEAVIEITGDSRYTDRDNPTSVEAYGEETIDHDMRYKTVDRKFYGEAERSIRDEEITGIAGGVSAGTHYVSFDLISFEMTEGEEVSYTYHFEDPNGEWDIHELTDSEGWAFCRPLYEDCS